jgi:hypothetical protein
MSIADATAGIGFEVDVHNCKLLVDREFENDGIMIFEFIDKKEEEHEI